MAVFRGTRSAMYFRLLTIIATLYVNVGIPGILCHAAGKSETLYSGLQAVAARPVGTALST